MDPIESPNPAGPEEAPELPGGQPPADGGNDTPQDPQRLSEPHKLTPDEERLAKDQKLAAEAARNRVRAQQAEKNLAEAQVRIAELERKMNDFIAKSEKAPQRSPEDDNEVIKLRRELAEQNQAMKNLAEQVRQADDRAKEAKVKARVAQLVSEGKFLAPEAISILLRSAIVIDDDGEPVLLVRDGGEDLKVSATVENLSKYKPIPNFDSFVPSRGGAGAGTTPPKNGGKTADGIDWARVEKNDVGYIQANLTRIQDLRRQGKAPF